MTKKKAAKRDPSALPIRAATPDEDKAVTLARESLRPSVRAAVTIDEYSKSIFGELDLGTLINELVTHAKAANDGNLNRAEAMLMAQAHTLDAMFNQLARRANKQEYLKNFEAQLRLALKAQSQCVRTLEVLAGIKNPPVVIAKQANIAGGHQQINNGSPAPTRPRETEILQNELLEHTHGERLDTGTTGTASGTDQAMATMGEVQRAEVSRR